MAYQQQFHNRLLQQLNNTNGKNLELQSLLASKDDEIMTLDSRLKNTLATNGEGSCSSFCIHQRRNAELINGRNEAETAVAAAEAKLKATTKNFTIVEADLKKQISHLQQDVRKRDELLRKVAETCGPDTPRSDPAYGAPGPSTANNAELKQAKAELKRLRTAYSSLQKQFEAEKKETARMQIFPAAAPEKLTRIEEADQDDEEVIPNLKHERLSVSETPLTAPPTAPTVPPAAEPTSVSRTAKAKRRVQPTPVARSQTPELSDSTFVSLSRRRSAKSQARPSVIGTPKSVIPQKRKSPSKPTPFSRSSKRRRMIEETESSESEDLINDNDFTFSDAEDVKPRKRSKPSGVDTKHLQDTFEFIAITKHEEDGTIESFHSKEDLKGECDELWDAIRKVHDLWEEAKGEEWAWEFEKRGYNPVVSPCVTTKLKSKSRRMQWREDCEGKYACKRCVEEGRPCFTWNGEEFWLLPLHEEDRKWPVQQDNEIRWWLNIE